MVRSSADTRDRKEAEPLDVELSVSFRFGDAPEDRVTVIDQRHVPMVGSVFESRDVLVRSFVRLLLKAGVSQPRVLGEIIPALKLLRRR